jgi:hypothetical protein
VLRLDDFVADVLGADRTPNMNLSLFDVTDGSRNLLFGANSASEGSSNTAETAGTLNIIREFEVAGRRWSLMAAVNGERGWNSGDVLPYCLSLVGALLTGLLAQHQINLVATANGGRAVRQRPPSCRTERGAQRSRTAAAHGSRTRGVAEKADSPIRPIEFLAMVSREAHRSTPSSASAMLAGRSR